MEKKIIEAMNSPKELEILYRENSDEFSKAFQSVFANHPESTVLQVWKERLIYETKKNRVFLLGLSKIFSFYFY